MVCWPQENAKNRDFWIAVLARGGSFLGTRKANPHGMVGAKNDSRTILYRVPGLRLRKPLKLPEPRFRRKNADSRRVSNLPEDRQLRTGAHQPSMGEGSTLTGRTTPPRAAAPSNMQQNANLRTIGQALRAKHKQEFDTEMGASNVRKVPEP